MNITVKLARLGIGEEMRITYGIQVAKYFCFFTTSVVAVQNTLSVSENQFLCSVLYRMVMIRE